MEAEQIAQKIADKFSPPYMMNVRKRLSHDKLKALPVEERYVEVERRASPDSSTMVVERGSDGYPSIRSLTYLEIVEAVLKVLEEENANDRKSSTGV